MISKQQLKEESLYPEVLRSCYNCSWLDGALSLWCTSKKAINARGTSIPGCVHCPYWRPDEEAQEIINYNKKCFEFQIVD